MASGVLPGNILLSVSTPPSHSQCVYTPPWPVPLPVSTMACPTPSVCTLHYGLYHSQCVYTPSHSQCVYTPPWPVPLTVCVHSIPLTVCVHSIPLTVCVHSTMACPTPSVCTLHYGLSHSQCVYTPSWPVPLPVCAHSILACPTPSVCTLHHGLHRCVHTDRGLYHSQLFCHYSSHSCMILRHHWTLMHTPVLAQHCVLPTQGCYFSLCVCATAASSVPPSRPPYGVCVCVCVCVCNSC